MSISFWLFAVSRLNCATQIVPSRSATAVAEISFAIVRAPPSVIHPAALKPTYMVTSEPPTTPHDTNLIFSQSIRHLPQVRTLSTPIQLTAAVTNPIVRVSFCDGVFCANFTVAMLAALTTGAANRSRDARSLCPCLLRRSGFYKKNSFFVADCVLLSHPFDDMVSDINRIKRHRYLPFLSGATSCQSHLAQTLVLSLCRLQ